MSVDIGGFSISGNRARGERRRGTCMISFHTCLGAQMGSSLAQPASYETSQAHPMNPSSDSQMYCYLRQRPHTRVAPSSLRSILGLDLGSWLWLRFDQHKIDIFYYRSASFTNINAVEYSEM